jgi:holo-ACP synthase/triphosphoribosyl-dephospho-CoA synthase
MADGGMLSQIGRGRIHELDSVYSVHKNISPGGSADLLAVTYFLHKIETEREELLIFSNR